MTIAMVVLLLLSLTLVLVSVASADIVKRTYTEKGGVVTYEGKLDSKGKGYEKETVKILVFEGEEIFFENNDSATGPVNVKITGPYDYDGDTKSGCKDTDVNASDSWECSEDNYYFKVWEVDNSTIGGWFQADEHSFKLELENEKVREGQNFTLEMKKNNKGEGVMKLEIEDDKGPIQDEIKVNYTNEREFKGFAEGKENVIGIHIKDKDLVFNTSELEMDAGKYTIKLEDYATEVEATATITIEERSLKVECDKEVVKGDDIVVKIDSSFYKENAIVNLSYAGVLCENKTEKLDDEGDGTVRFSIDNREGRYKITVTVEVAGHNMEKIKYVTVKEGSASLEVVPTEATVGDIVTLKGKSNFGNFARVYIDDEDKKTVEIEGDEFEWVCDTSDEIEGYKKIEVFILEKADEEVLPNKIVDASASIYLNPPEFSMTVPKSVAEEDEVVVSGSATGTDHIFLIVINYKGGVEFPAGGNATATPVEDGKWEENIGELDSGRYTVIALYEGKDGVTDAIKDLGKPNAEWVAGDGSKTLEQRVAILMDAITSAGSDDLFGKADFSVSAPKVILKEPKTVVEIGDEITVKAETNIKTGAKAFVSLSQNSSILKKTFTLVENSCVTTSINTSGLQPGKYNVSVDISGRASAEKEITLVDKKEVVDEGKEETAQNVSLIKPGTAEEANESIGEGKDEINESYEEEEKRKIPVNVWDLVIAVVVASAILAVVRHRRRRR